MRFLWIGLALCVFVASAGPGAAQVSKPDELSLLATGTVDIDEDGTVAAHVLDQPDELPPAVVRLLGKAIPQWRFEPVEVDGKVIKARARMTVRVAANKQDDGNYRLRVNSASFGGEQDDEAGESVVVDGKLTPPRYPMQAHLAGIQGTVYLVLKIGRQGQVEDVVEEQTNLTVLVEERKREQARSLLARTAMSAARKWRFKPPTLGEQADDPHWSVRVPVNFVLCYEPPECGQRYGAWHAYIPGPKNSVPWISDEDIGQSPDAMVAGGAYPVGAEPRLLTRLDEG